MTTVRDHLTNAEREMTTELQGRHVGSTVLYVPEGVDPGEWFATKLVHPSRLCADFVATNEAMGNVHRGCQPIEGGTWHVADYLIPCPGKSR